MRIKISNIKINPGRREAEPKAVEELARSITAVGLMNPVTLDQNNNLVAGLHRLEAAKLLGWTEIECTTIGMDSVQAELAEIDENIVRTKLNRQELCEQLLRRKEIYETLHPETRHGMRVLFWSRVTGFIRPTAVMLRASSSTALGSASRRPGLILILLILIRIPALPQCEKVAMIRLSISRSGPSSDSPSLRRKVISAEFSERRSK